MGLITSAFKSVNKYDRVTLPVYNIIIYDYFGRNFELYDSFGKSKKIRVSEITGRSNETVICCLAKNKLIFCTDAVYMYDVYKDVLLDKLCVNPTRVHYDVGFLVIQLYKKVIICNIQ